MTENTPIPPPSPLEMWGGVECSVVRVGPARRDQLALNGHWTRLEDLDRFAALGLRALRYPILWEHHADPDQVDWSWADERLHRLRALGIRPIVGFVHHGSGARDGGLLDPGFVDGLARFARAVAERYPWIDAYTPVNEPATTARFSGLYGLWHPHGRDMACFGRCFLNECLGTRAAMTAIREINPAAQLIQTEDVGKTHSTPHLAYQAAYENERRWLTFDVLCGRVDPRHPVHAHLLECGVPAAELESFVAHPCPPDLLGMNHYVTSERFLDERLDRYPRWTHGGNGREAYADVDAVRVRAEGVVGVRGLLHELWDRYRRPIAITEVQLACTREEQVRWLIETWHEATQARAEGVEVRAVTPWALLGSFDWNSLLVEAQGYYESGAFDVRSADVRPTALAAAIAGLARDGRYEHPLLGMPGWWRRPMRLEYPPVAAPATGPGTAFATEPRASGRPLLVVGAAGALGQAFLRLCDVRGLPTTALTRRELDVTDAAAVRDALSRLRPWAVVNCTGFTRIDAAEATPEDCFRANVLGAANLAHAGEDAGSRLVTFSSDLVFDGTLDRLHVESDPTQPLNAYGRSKRDAEKQVLEAGGSALIIRPGAVFGPWSHRHFAAQALGALGRGQPFHAAAGSLVSPTYLPDLVNAALDLLIDGEAGIWHLANEGAASWHAWAKALAAAADLPADHLVPTDVHVGWIAPRPRNAGLGSERGRLLPQWQQAVERYVAAVADARTLAAA